MGEINTGPRGGAVPLDVIVVSSVWGEEEEFGGVNGLECVPCGGLPGGGNANVGYGW